MIKSEQDIDEMPYATKNVNCTRNDSAVHKLRAMESEKTKIIKDLIDAKKINQQSNLDLIQKDREITKLHEKMNNIKQQNELQVNKLNQKSNSMLHQKDREINKLNESLEVLKNQNQILANELKELSGKYHTSRIENSKTAREFKALTAKFKQLFNANDIKNQSQTSERVNSSDSDDGEYDVVELLDDKIINGKKKFLVKWKNSWVEKSRLNCPTIMKKYLKSKN